MINGLDMLVVAFCFIVLLAAFEIRRRLNEIDKRDEERERRRLQAMHKLVVQDTLNEHIYRQELKYMIDDGLIPTMKRVTKQMKKFNEALTGPSHEKHIV